MAGLDCGGEKDQLYEWWERVIEGLTNRMAENQTIDGMTSCYIQNLVTIIIRGNEH